MFQHIELKKQHTFPQYDQLSISGAESSLSESFYELRLFAEIKLLTGIGVSQIGEYAFFKTHSGYDQL
jgi:hypothetical protein